MGDKPRKRRIGFAGCPPQEVLAPLREEELIDLDNLFEGAGGHSETHLPRTTCRIIRRILDNALSGDLNEIIIDEGYGKCDAARGVADVLEDLLDIPIIRTDNDNTKAEGTPIADASLPLRRKMELILDGLVHPREVECTPQLSPPAAMWGVPAADFGIYDLFPDGTQILGWTRCLENRTPADWKLEMWVPEGVPTVFFAQTFCPKNVIAHHLAHRHGGLHVDVDGVLSLPVRAKIEAFLRFKGACD
jgi:hypothetical protein